MKKCLFILLLLLICFSMKVEAKELISHAKSGILMEVSSGKILYDKNSHERVSVASMTKMVGQIIIMEAIEEGKIHWTDTVTVSSNASGMGGSQIYLETGEKMSVEGLMKGISVASGNDATVAMAEYIAGSEEKFVQMMNDKVKELGLKNTHFVNSTGLDEENHYSSAYDMAVIARELVLKHPDILRFSSIYEDYLREDTNRKFWLVNTNKLINQYEGCDGLKTGHTDDADYCLAATANRDGMRLIAIVLGEEDSKVRNKETMELLDNGFQSMHVEVLKKKGDIIDEITLEKANLDNVSVVLKDDLIVVEDIGEKRHYHYRTKLNPISFPSSKGDVIGTIEVLLDGKIMTKGDLVLAENVFKKPLLTFIFEQSLGVFIGNY